MRAGIRASHRPEKARRDGVLFVPRDGALRRQPAVAPTGVAERPQLGQPSALLREHSLL